ncbi:hypothetical protein ACR6C2_07735 [Streptomyces sp. INA 01156]
MRNYVAHTNSQQVSASLASWLIAEEDADPHQVLSQRLSEIQNGDAPTDAWPTFIRTLAAANECATQDRTSQRYHSPGLEDRVAALEEQVAALMADKGDRGQSSAQP